MLKMRKVGLEKISDADMHLFIEKGKRGGISYINKRYSKANKENCPNYDKEKLLDLDYSKNLHEDHSDISMAPEKIKIKKKCYHHIV